MGSFDNQGGRETTPKSDTKKVINWDVSIYMGPITFIIGGFVLAPLLIILVFAFVKSGQYGEIIYEFTTDNMVKALGWGYGGVFIRSFYVALQTTLACLLVGYPLAYWISRHGGRHKLFLISLVIIPSWVAYLIRLYAFKTIAGSKGIINSSLSYLGIITEPLDILYTPLTVMVGLVYTWLPFMVLPLYAALEGLNPSVKEAAADLGASPARCFFRVTLPLTRGGIIAGCFLTFIPSLGDWLVPAILGGAKVMMVGNLIAHQFTVSGDVPAGCSLAVMLAATMMLILYLAIKWAGREAMEKLV